MRCWMLTLAIAMAAVAPALAQPGLPPATPPPAPSATPSPAPSPAPPAAEAEPSLESQVGGTCRTPREAMLQLLYWVQDGEERVDPARAAACFDRAGLTAAEVAERAVKLKRTLDLQGLYVDVEAIPAVSSYVAADGVRRWRLPDLPEVEIVKHGPRWVFSAATVKAVPRLHAEAAPSRADRVIDSLPAWFHDHFLGLAVWQLVGILLAILLALTLQRIVVFVLNTYARRAADRLALRWMERGLEHVARPIGGLAMAGVFGLAGPWLELPARLDEVLDVAVAGLAAFSVAWLAYRLVDVLTDWLEVKASATSSKLDDQLVPLLRKTLKVFIAAIGTVFLLQNINVDVGSLLAGLGLGGLAFALAARDTIANFFGSLVVFIDKPFQVGDWVVIDGTEGTVEEVGFRTTRVRTFYNSLVTIPNAKLTDTAIDNYGARRWRRYVANLGLTYDTPPERMEAFCAGVRAIIQRLDGMRRDYAIVEFNNYADSGLNVMVYCFMDAPDWGTELRIRTNLNLEILRLAADLGVSFAFPTRTLHIDTQATATAPAARPVLGASELASVIARYGPRPAPALGSTPGAPPAPAASGDGLGDPGVT